MSAAALEAVAGEVRVCQKCSLSRSRTNAVPGEGPSSAGLMIVGEGPGANEDAQGRPFVGAAGQNLERLLGRAGLAKNDVFITNTVKCRPPGNRRPRREELDACHPYLRRQIEIIKPRVVLLLGDTALKEFFPDSSLPVLHGRLTKRGELLFFPTYHPAAIIYNRSLSETLEKDFAELGRILAEGSASGR